MQSEAARHADFSTIRYAQVWEDADILLEALNIQPGDKCVAIASAGDNALAMLSRSPGRVIALDLNPAQLACMELRVAAFRTLEHAELLELIGSRPSERRSVLYQRCREVLPYASREFWDARPAQIQNSIGSAGKFENYFRLFRTRVLPLVHSRKVIARLLEGGDAANRKAFYARELDSWRWRLLFRLFFSRTVMGRMGRDPSFFRYVEGDVASRILERARYALTELDPAENPYLQWILTGTHTTALPYALRPENFEAIRANLDKLEIRHSSLEEYLAKVDPVAVNCFNLSDVFEYMSQENTTALMEKIVRAARPGARLAYWNMLVPRRRPESLAANLHPLCELSARLHARDKAFFYSAFVVEEVQ